MNRLLFDVFAALILGVTAVIGAFGKGPLWVRPKTEHPHDRTMSTHGGGRRVGVRAVGCDYPPP